MASSPRSCCHERRKLMFDTQREELIWAGRKLVLETGRMARQADGAVLATYGETTVLATVVSAKEPKPGFDFFPLTVNYQERAYAAGRIPGGYFKREGRPSEKETLVSRLIDRPIRPLFVEGYKNDTQVVVTVLSHDLENDPDIVGMVAASAALTLSGVPFMGPIGAARVGYCGGQSRLTPPLQEMEETVLDLVVAGTADAVLMVESEAKELPEDVMLGAVMFGHKHFQPVIEAIIRLAEKAAKEPRDYQPADASEDAQAKVVRWNILDEGKRIDGRDVRTVRPILAEVGVLPRAHGSALFTRGETQALVVTTLGTGEDEQFIDELEGTRKETFLLHYNFPPYSVGETGRMGSPGRREIGHGKLAWRAIHPMLPPAHEFPYTLRVVSEVTESNGSSSMATVCGSSLALMDAGVPLRRPVAGIAMGLILEGERFAVLSDILGDEDHLGDMDFKVAGTANGVTSLQMDIKITGVDREIMRQALYQAKQGRMHILSEMGKTLSAPRTNVSGHAPRIITIRVKPDKIREIIGPGGKVIRGIIEATGVKMDVEDDGTVTIASSDEAASQKAIQMVQNIAAEAEVGKIYKGTVRKIVDFGAFVEIFPGTDGLIHISQLAPERVRRVADVLKEGDEVMVKVLEVDRQGKIRLSRKEALQDTGAGQTNAGGGSDGGPQE